MSTRYVHTSLIASDWRRLAAFYQDAFGCVPVLPERNLSGAWLDRATGIDGARITGIHLRLPGHGESGPTLEIFEYEPARERPRDCRNSPGLAHLAFEVDDVESAARAVLEHGGSTVGELTNKEIPGAGVITFQYLADPEGNVIELQRWGLPSTPSGL